MLLLGHLLLNTHLQLACHEKSRGHSQGCLSLAQHLCQAPLCWKKDQEGQVPESLHGLKVCSACPAAQPVLLATLEFRHCFRWAVMGTASPSCNTRDCGCSSIYPVGPTRPQTPPPFRIPSLTPPERKMSPANHNSSSKNRHCRGVKMWPPDCMGRHLAHARDTPQKAPERCLCPLPHHCCIASLGSPSLVSLSLEFPVWDGRVQTSAQDCPLQFITWVLASPLHPSPAGLGGAAQPCGVQESFLPL